MGPAHPDRETLRALDDEVRAGRILYLGISDTPAWIVAQANTLADWRDWTAFAGLQVPYSLLQRDIERELLPMAGTLGLSVAAWSPLAGGILSGKYTNEGHPEPGSTRVDPASVTEHQRRIATTLQSIGDEIEATPSQIAIAWTRARSAAIHPIIGARTLDQLRDNLAAIDLVIPPEALTRLDAATRIELGFPTTFITETSPWVLGAASLSTG